MFVFWKNWGCQKVLLKLTDLYEGMNIKKEPLWKYSYCFSENIFAHCIAHDTLCIYLPLFSDNLGPEFSVWWQTPSHWIVHFRAKHEILLQNIYYIYIVSYTLPNTHHCTLHTEVRFASFLSGGFTTMAVINQPEKKLAKCTSVYWFEEKGIDLWRTWRTPNWF